MANANKRSVSHANQGCRRGWPFLKHVSREIIKAVQQCESMVRTTWAQLPSDRDNDTKRFMRLLSNIELTRDLEGEANHETTLNITKKL